MEKGISNAVLRRIMALQISIALFELALVFRVAQHDVDGHCLERSEDFASSMLFPSIDEKTTRFAT